MIDVTWWLFLPTSLLLIVTPGQDMVLVMSRSIAQGPEAGITTAAGVSVGLVAHTALATLGLGALLKTSELLFFVVKLVGALYLIFIGIQMLRHAGKQLTMTSGGHNSRRRLFIDGALSNVANPKIAIFYFAFLPQFVSPDARAPTLSVFALGLTFAALTFVVKAPIGLGAGMLSAWLRARSAVLVWLHRCTGAVLVVLGFRLVLEPGH